MASVMYDGVVVPGGAASVEALRASGDAVHFVAEAFKHCKPIAAVGAGVDLLSAAGLPVGARAKGRVGVEQGVVTGGEGADPAAVGERLVEALGQHRFFGRPGVAGVSA